MRIADRCLEIQGRVGQAHIERCAGRLDPAAGETREVGWHEIHLTSGLDRANGLSAKIPGAPSFTKNKVFRPKMQL